MARRRLIRIPLTIVLDVELQPLDFSGAQPGAGPEL